MSEETKVDEYGEEITEEEANENDDTAEKAGDKKKSKKTIKTFLQADVDRVVKNRLSIEKKKNKKAVDDNIAESELLNSTITGYEGIIKEIIEAKKIEMPDEYLELINKLSLSEQYEFLINKDKVLQEKKKIPKTPVSKDKDDKTKSETFKKVRVF